MDRPEQLTDLTGHVVRISTELLFRTGSAYFIELQLYMDQADGADSFSVIDSHRKTTLSICQPTVFLILTESHSESLEKLQVHAKYNFLKVKQVVWQQSVEAGSALNRGNQDIRCHAESVPSWYSMTGQSTIKSLRYQYTDNNSDINQLIEFSVIDSDMSCCRQLLESFKSPINLLFIDLTVMISNARIYSSFLKPISIVDRGLLSALEVNIRIKVYKCHEDGWMEVGPPSFRLFVYMSHYRRNFDVTSIKEGNFIMLLSVLPIYLWGRLQGFACTIRSTISSPLPLSLSSSKCLPTSVMVSIHSSLRHNLRSQLPIPSDIKKCSYLYNAWKCYQLTKLQAHYFNSDTITRLLNFIVELSLSSIRLSAADKMSSRDHGLTLLQLCKLPARAIQHEFASASHLELFMIRSGHDSDWLNSQLPQVNFVTVKKRHENINYLLMCSVLSLYCISLLLQVS